MDKCFNCGAAVRPGAKFCTSCGTRLIENSAPAPAASTPESTSWGQASSTDETQIAAPVVQAGDEPATSPASAGSDAGTGSDADETPFASWKHVSSGWNTGNQDASRDASPADRFETALDTEGTSTESSSTQTRNVGWGKPVTQAADVEDRFASWAAAYKPGTTADTTDDTTPTSDETNGATELVAEESVIITPEATSSDNATTESATDAAGFTNGGKREVDYLSGDENVATGGPAAGIAASRVVDGSDARSRASELIDELRGLVWTIGEAQPASAGDTTDVRNILSGVRGQTVDFSDLERAIAAVRESPRDIDALRELGDKAARLEELLESHARLAGALDDAIHKLR